MRQLSTILECSGRCMRQLSTMADQAHMRACVRRMHLRVRVDIHSLQGTVCAWVPPPPNDRLWFGFVSAPELRAEAAPLLNQNVRMLCCCNPHMTPIPETLSSCSVWRQTETA